MTVASVVELRMRLVEQPAWTIDQIAFVKCEDASQDVCNFVSSRRVPLYDAITRIYAQCVLGDVQ